MTEADTPQVVSGYLAELDRELADVTEEVRQGIVAGIAEELQGLDAEAAASRIESLGDPAFIAAEARAGAESPVATSAAATPPANRLAPPRASERRWYVVVTTVLLEFGGLVVPLAGWVAGIMLLWASPLWTRREKLVATTVPAGVGVLLFGLLALVGSHLMVWHVFVISALVGSIVASIVIGIVLSRRAWDRAR